jgi:hypothetical protein
MMSWQRLTDKRNTPHLQAVADAEDGDAQLKDLRVHVRRVLIVYRVGRAR